MALHITFSGRAKASAWKDSKHHKSILRSLKVLTRSLLRMAGNDATPNPTAASGGHALAQDYFPFLHLPFRSRDLQYDTLDHLPTSRERGKLYDMAPWTKVRLLQLCILRERTDRAGDGSSK